MRHRRFEIAFVLCACTTGALAYLALLGDSGLWRRHELRREAGRLEQSVEMLRQENQVLFSRLHGGSAAQAAQVDPPGQDMWVLKFEGTPEGESARLVRPEESISLSEARILFGVGFVLFVLVGLYFTATVMRNFKVEMTGAEEGVIES